METFKLGQLVKIKERFATGKERMLTYRIVEMNGDRCYIEPIEWAFSIPPQEYILIEFLESA